MNQALLDGSPCGGHKTQVLSVARWKNGWTRSQSASFYLFGIRMPNKNKNRLFLNSGKSNRFFKTWLILTSDFIFLYDILFVLLAQKFKDLLAFGDYFLIMIYCIRRILKTSDFHLT